jgi:magnesium-transporting ATPase (P-type)
MQLSLATQPIPDVAWHALDPEQALGAIRSGSDGLDDGEVDARRTRFGANAVPRSAGPGLARLFARQLNSSIVYLLLAAAAIAIGLGKVLDGVVVLGAIVVNAAIGFVQELRAGRAIEALTRMVPQSAQVVRNGRPHTIASALLVPGDVVLLSAGDRVPADARLLSARNLLVDEASLTGESTPVLKAVAPVAEGLALADRSSMAFGGTLVTAGYARAVVIATGAATELGRISRLLQETSELETPLTRAIRVVGAWLTGGIVLVSAVLLVVGLARGYGVAEALLVGVTLAVASIPEGLPAIITIALAVGVQRMAKRNAIVRWLPSVETLGSTTVICSDKTGTLTRNEMTVQALTTPDGDYELGGTGYAPLGDLLRGGVPLDRAPGDVVTLVTAAALCSDACVRRQAGSWQLAGDPTEGALVVAAAKLGIDVEALRREDPRLDVIPFDSELQFMATLHADGAVYLKGAPEVVLARCDLSAGERALAMQQVAAYASGGMRVLAVADKRLPAERTALEVSDVVAGLRYLGVAGMMDPPRPEAIDAVRACRAAGVTVKMITGDHVGTAEAIARQLDLLPAAGRGVTGSELSGLADGALREVARSTNVFARVAPEHKLRLVRALQDQGSVVAMTGDGVNDAPALKQANIGVAMGITGTAAAKEAADVVLADDNFASIAAAIEEGRRIYDNLVKSLAFILPINLGLGLILIAAVAWFPVVSVNGELVPLMPALPAQLLWINLVTSVALSLPLAFEVAEPDVMTRPPRSAGAPFLDRFVVVRTAIVAATMAAGALGLFLWEYYREVGVHGHELALREAQTVAMTTVVFFQIYYLLHCRSLRAPVLRSGLGANRVVSVGIATLLVLQAAFIYLPPMQALFGTAPLGWDALLTAAAVAAVIIPLISAEKAIRRRTA